MNATMVNQADGSNDCAVYMLHVFAAFLSLYTSGIMGRMIRGEIRQIMIHLDTLSMYDFGQIGRLRILQSLRDHLVDLKSDTANAIKIELISLSCDQLVIVSTSFYYTHNKGMSAISEQQQKLIFQ